MSSTGAASVSNDSPVNLAQQFLGRGERALRLRSRSAVAGIVRGARFLHVGDGDQADFETLVGLFELARDRLERRLRGVDACPARRARRSSAAPCAAMRSCCAAW